MANTLMLGSLLASFLAFQAAAYGQPAQDPDSTLLPRAKWLENGIIDAGGSHEPYTFMVRAGYARPGGATFTVPDVKTYSIAAVSW